MHTIENKWWFNILQGTIFLSSAIVVLTGLVSIMQPVTWFAIPVMLAGLLGLMEWIENISFDRSTEDLLWNIINIIAGFTWLLLSDHNQEFFFIYLAIWLLISSFWLLVRSWALQPVSPLGWGMMIAGLLCFFFGVMLLISPGNIDNLNASITVTTFLLFGLALIMLANIKKWMMQEG
jgi:uncharacterized membrane protein HdeD (DUF308 family)